MKKPKTIWKWSPTTESFRILLTARSIKNNFFRNKGFFVLPYPINGHPRTVYFPSLPYEKTPCFWKKTKKKEITKLNNNSQIIQQISNLLKIKQPDFSSLQKNWEKIEKSFWKKLSIILPNEYKSIKSLEIRPTLFGVKCTAYSSWLKNTNHIVVYVRTDVDIGNIAKAILLDRLNKKLSFEKYSWEEKQAIMDFLITKDFLGKSLENHKSTLTALRKKQQAKLAIDSENYLNKLGFGKNNNLKIKNKQIIINNKKIDLTEKEKVFLKLLIKNQGQIVSFDQIADLLWAEKSIDKFSLYAITKLVQRTRKKLFQAGISPEIIQTKKSKGYLLI